jgi:hypothetical protein
MIVSRFVKWAAAGVLALGIPAMGMARTHVASVPGSLSVTPVKAVSSHKHATKKVSSHRKSTARKHSKHTRAHAKKNAKRSKSLARTASKSHRSTNHKKTRRA